MNQHRFRHSIRSVLFNRSIKPFWLGLPGKKIDSGDYRWGFNRKESDQEWGSQLIQDYGFRIYNPSVGKFLSVDPLAPDYPWYSPYHFAGNTPIWAYDLDGLEPRYTNFWDTPFGYEIGKFVPPWEENSLGYLHNHATQEEKTQSFFNMTGWIISRYAEGVLLAEGIRAPGAMLPGSQINFRLGSKFFSKRMRRYESLAIYQKAYFEPIIRELSKVNPSKNIKNCNACNIQVARVLKGEKAIPVSPLEEGISDNLYSKLLAKEAGIQTRILGLKFRKQFSGYLDRKTFEKKLNRNLKSDGDFWVVNGYPRISKGETGHTFVIHRKFDKNWVLDAQGEEVIFTYDEYAKFDNYRFLKGGKAKKKF